MSEPRPPKVITVESLKPSFYVAFGIYWSAFVGYGLHAALLGVVSIDEQSPDLFAIWWGWLIAGSGLLAGIGVVLSHRLKKPWAEVVAICIVVGLMFGYIVAMIARYWSRNNWDGSSVLWLPLIVSIFPLMRIMWIANGDDLFKRSHAKAAKEASAPEEVQ